MLKKFLTLSLVAVILSVTALATPTPIAPMTAALAEGEVTVETIFIDGYTAAGSQTITYNPDNVAVRSQTKWALYKFTLPGEYESVSEVSLDVTYAGDKGTAYLWVWGLEQTYWDAAKAVSGSTISTDLFASPLNNLKYYVKDRHSQTTATALNVDLTDKAVDQAKSGVIYLAMTIDSNSGNGSRNGTISKVELSVKGVLKDTSEPVVDDFSDAKVAYDNATGAYTITTTTTTGEAYLIIASFTGTTMNDVELVPINAAEGLSGTVTPLEDGDIKVFLWDKATLAPAIGVSEF